MSCVLRSNENRHGLRRPHIHIAFVYGLLAQGLSLGIVKGCEPLFFGLMRRIFASSDVLFCPLWNVSPPPPPSPTLMYSMLSGPMTRLPPLWLSAEWCGIIISWRRVFLFTRLPFIVYWTMW